jgi:hypothetical protein
LAVSYASTPMQIINLPPRVPAAPPLHAILSFSLGRSLSSFLSSSSGVVGFRRPHDRTWSWCTNGGSNGPPTPCRLSVRHPLHHPTSRPCRSTILDHNHRDRFVAHHTPTPLHVRPAKMASHQITAIGSPVATVVTATSAFDRSRLFSPSTKPSLSESFTAHCVECKSVFCTSCDTDLHQPAKMAGHQRSTIGVASVKPSNLLSPSAVATSPTPPPSTSTVASGCSRCDEEPAELHCVE